jgi:hypothetical protein
MVDLQHLAESQFGFGFADETLAWNDELHEYNQGNGREEGRAW